MRKVVFIIMVFAAIAAGKPAGTNLRGQIIQNAGGHPLANIRVDLETWNGKAWVSYSYAVTGADGYYYFMNFPPGINFLLLVAGRYYPTTPLTIGSIPAGTYQDLPVISI
jgi:hypothetical protein